MPKFTQLVFWKKNYLSTIHPLLEGQLQREAAWTVEGEQLQCRQIGSNLIYIAFLLGVKMQLQVLIIHGFAINCDRN